MINLGTLAGAPSRALAINELGQVVGQSAVQPWEQAFMWEEGEIHHLGSLETLRTAVVAINDRGHIAGHVGTADAMQASVWTLLR